MKPSLAFAVLPAVYLALAWPTHAQNSDIKFIADTLVVQADRTYGKRIPFIKLGRAVRYSPADVIEYAKRCRRAFVMRYFGEELDAECAGCDVCSGPKLSIDSAAAANEASSPRTKPVTPSTTRSGSTAIGATTHGSPSAWASASARQNASVLWPR